MLLDVLQFLRGDLELKLIARLLYSVPLGHALLQFLRERSAGPFFLLDGYLHALDLGMVKLVLALQQIIVFDHLLDLFHDAIYVLALRHLQGQLLYQIFLPLKLFLQLIYGLVLFLELGTLQRYLAIQPIDVIVRRHLLLLGSLNIRVMNKPQVLQFVGKHPSPGLVGGLRLSMAPHLWADARGLQRFVPNVKLRRVCGENFIFARVDLGGRLRGDETLVGEGFIWRAHVFCMLADVLPSEKVGWLLLFSQPGIRSVLLQGQGRAI